MIRRQLPVYSPLSFGALMKAVASAWNPFSGDPREALAELLKDRYQADQVVLTGSGTQALTLAIRMARRGDDAPVALPAFTCYDVATAAVGAGAPILLYDVDPETLGPDWASLESTLENGAGVAVVAPLYGVPVDWDRVERLASRYDVPVVEDAAQGIGASWRGRPLGSLAPISVLSFGRGKGWTGGRGGALLARDASPDRLVGAGPKGTAELSTAGSVLAQWVLARPSLYGLPARIPWLHLGETRYREPTAPRGLARFSAAVILATDEAVLREAESRRSGATRIARMIQDRTHMRAPAVADGARAGYLRLPCRVTDPGERARLLAALAPAGVAPSYPTALSALAAVRKRLVKAGAAAGADTLARQLVTFPTHSRLAAIDFDLIRRALQPTADG